MKQPLAHSVTLVIEDSPLLFSRIAEAFEKAKVLTGVDAMLRELEAKRMEEAKASIEREKKRNATPVINSFPAPTVAEAKRDAAYARRRK